jgi:cell division protein FtsN
MKYLKEAEQTNGRLAMMGFFAVVVNYGFTGWIIPGIF